MPSRKSSSPTQVAARPESATPSNTGHRTDIQGLRAVAVIGVVLYHAGGIVSGGFVGVDVFFVISGFVICRLLWREVAETGTISFRRFYRRRVRRLLPALAVVLLFVTAGSFIFQNPLGPQQDTATVAAAASFFSANAALLFLGGGGYFALSSAYQPLLHTWTLAVEEQFYLVLPVALLLLTRLARGRRGAVAAGLGLLGTLSFVLSYATTFGPTWRGSAVQSFAFYSSPTRAWEFVAGCLLALGEPFLARLGQRVGIAASGLGIVGILVSYVAYTDVTPFPGTAALLPVCATVLLVGGATASLRGIPQLLALRPLVWIGDLSYGWYLWHWPFLVFTRLMWPTTSTWVLLGVAAASLLPTWLSYRFVENPIRFNPAMKGRRVVRMAVVCIAVPLLAAVGLGIWARNPPASLAAVVDQGRPHVDVTHDCRDNLPDDTVTKTSCTWRVPDAKGVIYLVGDSNAGHFAEPAIAAAAAEGYDLVLATYGSCPLMDLTDRVAGADPAPCRNFVEHWTDFLQTAPASLLILANESANPLRDTNHRLEVPGQTALVEEPAAKAAAWEEALVRTLRQLQPSGSPVLLLHTVPLVRGLDLRVCPTVRLLTDPDFCTRTKSRAEVEEFGRPARRAEENAAAAVPGTATADFTDELCGPTSCSTRRDDLWLYKDSVHLSVPASMLLTPQFESLIATHAKPRNPPGTAEPGD